MSSAPRDVALGEWILLGVFAGTSAAALAVAAHDRALFARLFTDEDGLVETLTAVTLLLAAGLAWYRVVRLRRRRGALGLALGGLLGLAFLWAAGEEVSWGQRLLGFATPAYFEARNRQREVNVHNLAWGRARVQTVLDPTFVIGMSAAVTALPWLWHRSAAVRRAADRLGVPVPRVRHAVTFALAHAVTIALPGARRWEVYECLCAVLLLAILAYPANRGAFDP